MKAGQYTPRKSGKQVKAASRTPPPSFPSSVDVSESDESASDSGIDVSDFDSGVGSDSRVVTEVCYAGAKLHEPPRPEDLPSPPLEWLRVGDRPMPKREMKQKHEVNQSTTHPEPSSPAGWPISCLSTSQSTSSSCSFEAQSLTEMFKMILKVQA